MKLNINTKLYICTHTYYEIKHKQTYIYITVFISRYTSSAPFLLNIFIYTFLIMKLIIKQTHTYICPCTCISYHHLVSY